MYFLLKMEIFQPAMLVYQRVNRLPVPPIIFAGGIGFACVFVRELCYVPQKNKRFVGRFCHLIFRDKPVPKNQGLPDKTWRSCAKVWLVEVLVFKVCWWYSTQVFITFGGVGKINGNSIIPPRLFNGKNCLLFVKWIFRWCFPCPNTAQQSSAKTQCYERQEDAEGCFWHGMITRWNLHGSFQGWYTP